MIQIQELLVLRQRAVADFPSWLPAIWAHKQSELPRSHRMHWSYWDAQELLTVPVVWYWYWQWNYSEFQY